jgi:hypothetical protein
MVQNGYLSVSANLRRENTDPRSSSLFLPFVASSELYPLAEDQRGGRQGVAPEVWIGANLFSIA